MKFFKVHHHVRPAVKFVGKTLFFSLLFLTIFLMGISIRLGHQKAQYTNKIYPNVYIGNYHAGGGGQKEIENYFIKETEKLQEHRVEIEFEDTMATFSATQLAIKYDDKTAYQQAYSVGRAGPFFSRNYQMLVSLLNMGSVVLTPPVSYDDTEIVDYLTTIKETKDKPAKSALFQFDGTRVTAFEPEEKGLIVNTDAALGQIRDQISHIHDLDDNLIKVVVKGETVEPDVTLAEINDLGIKELIGSGSSNFTGSIPGRVHNVALSASRLNGLIIPPGKTFSYNASLGDVSAATGYVPAYIIKNGQTVLGDGGGICQTSTTLFRAAINAGLPIVERTSHAYRVSYYERDSKPGFDATVFDPTVDFKFTNDTPASILIQTQIDKSSNILTLNLYGQSDGRVANISDVKLWDVRPAPEPRNQDDPTLPRGTTKQVDFAASGARASFKYNVNRGSQSLQDTTFYSNYRPWQAVFLVGTGG